MPADSDDFIARLRADAAPGGHFEMRDIDPDDILRALARIEELEAEKAEARDLLVSTAVSLILSFAPREGGSPANWDSIFGEDETDAVKSPPADEKTT